MEHWWNENMVTNLNACRKTCPVPFRPPQLSYGMSLEQTDASFMTGCDSQPEVGI